MERLLFFKVELWVVFLFGLLGIVATVLFAAVIEEELTTPIGHESKLGIVGDVAVNVARVPKTARDLMSREHPMAVKAYSLPKGERTRGWNWQDESLRQEMDGYLLLSRYDGDNNRHVVELVRLASGETIHSWSASLQSELRKVRKDAPYMHLVEPSNWNDLRFRFIHPTLLQDGGLLIKDHYTPLFKIDACGKVLWVQDEVAFHHSTELGPDGKYYVAGLITPSKIEGISKYFHDDSIVIVNEMGEVQEEISVAQIMIDHGLSQYIFRPVGFHTDPVHLNDIQPILSDGPYWKKGDVFLSLRGPSMVILYRPSEKRVIWWQIGPWFSQHDVEIVNDHTIAVFSNNLYSKGTGLRSDVVDLFFYDFQTELVSAPFEKVLNEKKVKSQTESLLEILPDGELLLEIENAGRIAIFSPNADLIGTFDNMAGDGRSYKLGWSRHISDEEIGKTVDVLNSLECVPSK